MSRVRRTWSAGRIAVGIAIGVAVAGILATNARSATPAAPADVRARLPLLWHGDALWAVGADLRAHAFDAWLEREATRLLWQRSR